MLFLWLPLPERLLQADILAQNPEVFNLGNRFITLNELKGAIKRQRLVTEEWTWSRASRRVLLGESCGILGANRLDFIRHIADLAFEIIRTVQTGQPWPSQR